MNATLSEFQKWADSSFFKRGAYLTTTQDEVIFAKGGEISFSENISQTDSHSPTFYLKDFYSNRYQVYQPEKTFKLSKSDVLKWLESESVEHHHISPVNNDDDLYQKDFDLLKTVWSKNLEKVVLISRETYMGFEKSSSIKHFLKESFMMDAGWPYGIWNDDYGMIGSTPELLYEIKNKTLSTFALAGTARKGDEDKLLNSSKDRHEHDLVVKDIREKLKNFTSDLSIYETEILPFKSMVHLKTDIVSKIHDDLDITELTNSLSPTAALGGYPKESALNFLRNSNYSRKYPDRYFGSCFGVIAPNYTSFLVAIRNVQWSKESLYIESGGGVVPESDFQKELDEVHLKRAIIRNNYL